MRVLLSGSGPYIAKDQAKADLADKFIGRGSDRSSTNQYRIDAGLSANCGHYLPGEVVFISAEGDRRGRIAPDWVEIHYAVEARVFFVTDTPEDRNRAYNLGEREVAHCLTRHGYVERLPGKWCHISTPQ